MKEIDFNGIIKVFNANEPLLNMSYKNDNSLFNFDLKKCIDIIKCIKKNMIELPYFEQKVILTEGNPYLTLILCLYSIINKKDIILNIQENMINTNKQICEIFYNIFDIKDKNDRLIKIKEKMSISEMIKNCDNREIVIIDSKKTYNKYKKYGFMPIYIPFFSIDLLYNNSKYEELVRNIYDYCDLNAVEINVLENINVKDYKLKVNSVFESNTVLVLQDDISEEEIKKHLKGKKIYLNSNPFKDFEIDCIESTNN